MTNFQPFVMERMMSKFEQEVDYNLSESGVHPMLLSELLGDRPGAVDELLATDINYPYANGNPELRENIAAMYDGAGPDNVLVTVGAIEANYIAIRTLLDPGDEIVVMLPNYMQIWGVAKNHEYDLKTFHLQPENGWAPDIAELESVVTPDTKLIAVCNPNNPTGRIMTDRRDGRGSSRSPSGSVRGSWRTRSTPAPNGSTDEESPSFYGRYDRVLATGSMSKAYGLPGLRIGWVAGPRAYGRRHLGPSRVHGHQRRHAVQHPRRPRAVSRGSAADSRTDSGIHPSRLPGAPALDRRPPGAARAPRPPTPPPSPLSATTPTSTQPSSSRESDPRRAFWSSPATTSGSTSICG